MGFSQSGTHLLSALVPPVPSDRFHHAIGQIPGPLDAIGIAYDRQGNVRGFGFPVDHFGSELPSIGETYGRYNLELARRIDYLLYDGKLYDIGALATKAAEQRAERARLRAEAQAEREAWNQLFG